MEYKSPCSNNRCTKVHTIGSNVRYDKNYNVYCDNGECSEGIATIGSTTLEQDWYE